MANQVIRTIYRVMKVVINEIAIRKIVAESIGNMLAEGYLDSVYGSESFKRWFSGSKIVDENGRPKLLGHATRSFGFNRFNTDFIHLSTINNASFFSGGNRRMFKFKKTLSKLTDEEVIELYNEYFTYNGDSQLVKVTDEMAEKIISEYDKSITELDDPEEIKALQKYGINAENKKSLLKICKALFLKKYNKYTDKMYFVSCYNGLPRLQPGIDTKYTDTERIKRWLKVSFPTINGIRNEVIENMFKKDNYVGRGGTYALCARVLNPLHIDCHGNTWDKIYIYKDTPEYDRLFDKYCEANPKASRTLNRGSSFGLDNESIAYFAKKLGYDGVIFHNIREGAYGEAPMKETYIVFSTKQLKSPFENSGEFGDIENLFK